MTAVVVDPTAVAHAYRGRLRAQIAELGEPLRIAGLLGHDEGPAATYARYAAKGCESVSIEFDQRRVTPENVERAIAAVNAEGFAPKAFASPEDTRERLGRNGFDVERVALRPSPIRLDDPDVMERYLATVCLGSYLERMSEQEGCEFTRAVREAMVEPVLDYVRLEIDAVRR